jgi:hypothetical protein
MTSDSAPPPEARRSYSPLTEQEVLEHALRALVRADLIADAAGSAVGYTVRELRRPIGRSVLAERAAHLLERVEREEAGSE